MCNTVIAGAKVHQGHCQRSLRLLHDISRQGTIQQDLYSHAARMATIAFKRDQMKGLSGMGHTGTDKDLHCTVEITFHQKDGTEVVNMNITGLLFQNNLEACLVMGNGESRHEHQLSELGVEMGKQRGMGSRFVIPKVKPRWGRRCSFFGMSPVSNLDEELPRPEHA